MFKYLSCALLLAGFFSLSAQNGRIAGTIIDSKTGEPLPGATIMIEGTTKGAAADFDGKFSINNIAAGKVTLLASYISYNTKKIENIVVPANDVVNVNVGLDPSTSTELQEVEVVVSLNKENNTALVMQQKNNASVSDGISAETIKRTPDRNTSDVLKRVSGVVIQDDKFVIVRGLNERYNASYLNGSPLPSTEPDKKAFAFDLFPANMVESIVINKTATPDMPSEFAGGIVQVNTKSIPDRNFLAVSIGGGFNSVTTGRSRLVSEGGGLDRLGFDDRSRDLPNEVPALKDKSTWISNAEQARVGSFFPNDWAYSSGVFGPNFNAQVAAGYNVKRKEKDFLGVVFSVGYNSSNSRYTLRRSEYDGMDVNGVNTASIVVQKEREYDNEVYQSQYSTGSMLNFALKLNGNNSISLKNMFCGASDVRFIDAIGSNNLIEQDRAINKVTARYFAANRILSHQLNGDHLLPASKIKISWNGGFSNIRRSIPNLRIMSYSRYESFRNVDPDEAPNPLDTTYRANILQSGGPNYAGYRVYSLLNEQVFSGRTEISRLFRLNSSSKLELKTGAFVQARERQFDQRQFGVQPFNTRPEFFYLPEDQILAPENMRPGGFKMNELTKDDDNYFAASQLYAGFLMGEYKYTEKLRVITGLRYESYRQFLGVKYPFKDSTVVDNTVNDLLPSLNLVYNFTEKAAVRASYYKTLNRPEFRELALTAWFDPETRMTLAGNPALERSFIQNFDLRFELYPGRGQIFTTSGFYKYFDRPIERYMFRNNENLIYYNNANSGKIIGAELEYRVNFGAILRMDSVKFLSNLNMFSNLSFMTSEVDVAGLDSEVPGKRPMQGQAPYIINGGLSYIDKDNGFSITAAYNRVGPRIYLVGNNWVPNRWENARNVLDMQFTKSFYKNRLELRFNIRDMIQNDWIVFYKGNERKGSEFNREVDYINFIRNFGSTYSIALSYRF